MHIDVRRAATVIGARRDIILQKLGFEGGGKGVCALWFVWLAGGGLEVRRGLGDGGIAVPCRCEGVCLLGWRDA